tara:strand:+ start:31432 stop:32547 length:1116 start_codon:yes stop_codon:yes gene_type:complete
MQETSQANPYFLYFDTDTIENTSFLHPQIVQTNLPFDKALDKLRQEYEEVYNFVQNFQHIPKLPGKPSVRERIKSEEDYENLEAELQNHRQNLAQYNENEFEGSMSTRHDLAVDALNEIYNRIYKTRWKFIPQNSQDSIRIKIQQVYAFWLYRAVIFLNPYDDYNLYEILQIPWRHSNYYDWESKQWKQNIDILHFSFPYLMKLIDNCTEDQDKFRIQNAYALLYSPQIRQKYNEMGDYRYGDAFHRITFVQELTPTDMEILKIINNDLSDFKTDRGVNLAEFTTCAVCLEPQYVMSLLRTCANSNEQEQVLPKQHVRKHLVCAVCAQKCGEKCPICKQRGPWNLVKRVTPIDGGGFQEFTSNERFTSLSM